MNELMSAMFPAYDLTASFEFPISSRILFMTQTISKTWAREEHNPFKCTSVTTELESISLRLYDSV